MTNISNKLIESNNWNKWNKLNKTHNYLLLSSNTDLTLDLLNGESLIIKSYEKNIEFSFHFVKKKISLKSILKRKTIMLCEFESGVWVMTEKEFHLTEPNERSFFRSIKNHLEFFPLEYKWFSVLLYLTINEYKISNHFFFQENWNYSYRKIICFIHFILVIVSEYSRTVLHKVFTGR